MNSRVTTGLKAAISIGLVVLLFTRVDAGAVWTVLRGTRIPLLLLAVVLYLGAIASNALKWGVLLRAQGVRAPLSSLLRHTFVGVFFNNFLPFIGADMIRGYGLVREVSSTAVVAVSVLADRLIGLLAFTSAGAFSAFAAVRFFGIDAPVLLFIERIGLLLTLVLGVGFLLLLSGRLRHLVERLVARVPRLAPIAPIVAKLSAALGAYRTRPGALVVAYTVGLGTILLSNVVNYLLFTSIDAFATVDTAFPILYIFIFNPIVGLTMALPISIAGLGVNQHIFPFLYGLVGVREDAAVAASLLLQLIIVLTSLPGGLLWGMRQGAGPEPGTLQNPSEFGAP